MTRVTQVSFKKGNEITVTYTEHAALSAYSAFQKANSDGSKWVEVNWHGGKDLIRLDSVDFVEIEHEDEQFNLLKEEMEKEG